MGISGSCLHHRLGHQPSLQTINVPIVLNIFVVR
jgi:hypothetical protein